MVWNQIEEERISPARTGTKRDTGEILKGFDQ